MTKFVLVFPFFFFCKIAVTGIFIVRKKKIYISRDIFISNYRTHFLSTVEKLLNEINLDASLTKIYQILLKISTNLKIRKDIDQSTYVCFKTISSTYQKNKSSKRKKKKKKKKILIDNFRQI